MQNKIDSSVNECLRYEGISVNECTVIKNITCKNIKYKKDKAHEPGIYIFYDNNEVYYIGESNNVTNRLNMHCKIHIAGSEGVVRFLMYCLNSLPPEWQSLNAKQREDYVKNDLLKPFIHKLNIYVLICDKLKNPEGKRSNSDRRKLENCLRRKLNPKLNPL